MCRGGRNRFRNNSQKKQDMEYMIKKTMSVFLCVGGGGGGWRKEDSFH